ncbi:(2Fe-2S) ferredoxin domain-containing protein [Paenibacillus sp. SYP-B3998]|uniref:(2Fe-2S) ferredoxin domain-containing protein n=1 Tax=Paenibacillus sp. SYP-B3998 TaxID=2678564 RepID=A0A6G3ZQH3_9BACL|nr:(2Fe-2S) ferredoxin domain-containing protein [Paenibacillus sp. SYP-B3998]NEW04453.1 (2Fe-2S) ferredoxin domain-containing protein [Paenibacillus sp. SYP-B3998]
MSTWDLSTVQHHVLICNGGSCLKKLGDETTLAIRDEISLQGAEHLIHTTRTRCNGRCEDACVVTVYPEGVWYKQMTPEAGRRLVREHLLEGKPLEEQMIYSYQDRFVPTGQGNVGISRRKVDKKS